MEANREILKAVFNICRRNKDEVFVDQDYYEWFLGLSDKQLETIVGAIIKDRIDIINLICKGICEDRKTSKELYDTIFTFLWCVSRRIIQFSENNGGLVFLEPRGEKPSEVMELRIEQKIMRSIPIIDSVMIRIIHSQEIHCKVDNDELAL